MTMSFKVSCGIAPVVLGRQPFVIDYSISVLLESELGSHCQQ